MPEQLHVVAHPHICNAVANVVENALEHHSGDSPPAVDVTAQVDGDTVALVVEDDGPGVPQNEIKVIERETETDLEHGSGVGLWLVKWVVEESGGILDIENTGNGTRVTIELRRTARHERGEPTAMSD